MFLLVAAIRVYVGPGEIEIVWKGNLTFADTIVDLCSFTDIPTVDGRYVLRNDLAFTRPELLAQMEEMGLLTEEAQMIRKRRRAKKVGGSAVTAGKDKTATTVNAEAKTDSRPGSKDDEKADSAAASADSMNKPVTASDPQAVPAKNN